MRFDIITIFPHILDSYFNESILKRAQEKKFISVHIHDLRIWTSNKHRTVDDRPYGGGPGMILKVEPIAKALRAIKRKKKSRVILLDPAGKQFSQQAAKKYSKLDQLIFVCGRYEGFDERVKKYVDEKISIGPYVLSGGELGAMVILEAVARLKAGVLGNAESLQEESHLIEGYIEYPQYTRPEVFDGRRVPSVLLSGDHKKIEEWQSRKRRSSIF
ncbi:tRNA (guanosine(37)-N1)-methyltransferase TrmD [Candidatus Uhrbacteria bacterium]|nr:tRNA (guanosine(37)-N1)-methyltransferase TrmD [Candidatus Uhrbacteria bacterium]